MTRECGTDIRNTPRKGHNFSPAQMMMNRRTRTTTQIHTCQEMEAEGEAYLPIQDHKRQENNELQGSPQERDETQL